jgi:predicted nucleic acid-binding protein
VSLLIDSSVFIQAERRRLPVSTILRFAAENEALAMAALSVSELLAGLHLSQPSPQRELKRAFIEEVIDTVEILDFDLDVARRYAEVWATLRREGNLIAPHDLQIGATALVHGFVVITENLRDFTRVPGLEVRAPDW